MKKQMFEDAKNSDVLLQDLIGGLLESVEYGHESFINDAVRILDIIRIRIKRGDKITESTAGMTGRPAWLWRFNSLPYHAVPHGFTQISIRQLIPFFP